MNAFPDQFPVDQTNWDSFEVIRRQYITSVIATSGAAIANGGVVPYNLVAFDENKLWDAAAFAYKPKVKGWYHFDWAVTTAAALGTNQYWWSRLMVGANLAASGSMGVGLAATIQATSCGSRLWLCNPGDSVYVIVDQNSGGAQPMRADFPNFNHFEAFMVARL